MSSAQKLFIAVLVTAAFLCGCYLWRKGMSESDNRSVSRASPPGESSLRTLPQEKIVVLAEAEAKKAMAIPSDVQPTVENDGVIAIVEWPMKKPDLPSAQGDYYVKVKINRMTGKVIEVLSSP